MTPLLLGEDLNNDLVTRVKKMLTLRCLKPLYNNNEWMRHSGKRSRILVAGPVWDVENQDRCYVALTAYRVYRLDYCHSLSRTWDIIREVIPENEIPLLDGGNLRMQFLDKHLIHKS